MSTYISPTIANGAAVDALLAKAATALQASDIGTVITPSAIGAVEKAALNIERQAIEYVAQVNFEEPNGYNGWSNPDSVIFMYGGVTNYSREIVEDAEFRMNYDSAIAAPVVTDEWSRTGTKSAKFESAPDGPLKARCEAATCGTYYASRRLLTNVRYLWGFSLKFAPSAATFGGPNDPLWELYNQCSGNSTPKTGWGLSGNPIYALERASATELKLVTRYNKDDGTTETIFSDPFTIDLDGHNDFIVEFLWNNSGGYVVVYLNRNKVAEYRGRLGYVYDNQSTATLATGFGIYAGNKGEVSAAGRTVYVANYRLTKDPAATLTDVDPGLFINKTSHKRLSYDTSYQSLAAQRAVDPRWLNCVIRFYRTSGVIVLTIKDVSTTAYPIGAKLMLLNIGAGGFSFAGDPGVVVPSDVVTEDGEYIELLHHTPNIWYVVNRYKPSLFV
jgi:hypothetical protein